MSLWKNYSSEPANDSLTSDVSNEKSAKSSTDLGRLSTPTSPVPTGPAQAMPVPPNSLDCSPDGRISIVNDRSFEITVEAAFPIKEKGTIVTGYVQRGSVRVGDEAFLVRGASGKNTRILGIERFGKQLDKANTGDNVGVLLDGVDKADVRQGDFLRNSAPPQPTCTEAIQQQAQLIAERNQSNSLFDALERGDMEKVKMLLKNDPNVIESRDHNGWAPLHFAAGKGYENLSRFLMDNKADVNAKTNDASGWTPLHLAVLSGHKEVMELLLAYGAKLSIKNSLGRTPLDCAGI